MGQSILATSMTIKHTGLGISHWAMVMVIEESSKMACFMGKGPSIRRVSGGRLDLFMRTGPEAWWSLNYSRRGIEWGIETRIVMVNFLR